MGYDWKSVSPVQPLLVKLWETELSYIPVRGRRARVVVVRRGTTTLDRVFDRWEGHRLFKRLLKREELYVEGRVRRHTTAAYCRVLPLKHRKK